jgi:hypothetical protein
VFALEGINFCSFSIVATLRKKIIL